MDRKPTDELVCPQCGRTGDGPLGALCPIDASAMVEPAVRAELAERSDPIIGRVIAGRFPVVGLIGRGAYGTVYRAVQLPIGREVALKVMNTPRNEELRSRFFREARVVARLSHPSAVTLFDYGQDDDGLLYMVLEFIRGDTLRDVIRAESPMAPARAARLTLQVLGALVEAHQIGLIHRDLKPANIMLTREKTGEERAKVLDFGMAKVLEGQGQFNSDEATRTGLVVGTPRYLSPEQAMAREVGPPTDVYALGVVLYEMLAGKPPFQAPSTFELLVLHTTADVPPLDRTLAVPSAMEEVIQRAMAKQVDARFPDAQAMLDALRRASVGAPTASLAPRPAQVRDDRQPSVVEKLTKADLAAVARQARDIIPGAAQRAAAPTPPPAAPDAPTEAKTEPAPPPAPFRPETRSLDPPPLEPDALESGVSATHGEIEELRTLDQPQTGGWRWIGAALALVAAFVVVGWLLLERAPDPAVDMSARLADGTGPETAATAAPKPAVVEPAPAPVEPAPAPVEPPPEPVADAPPEPTPEPVAETPAEPVADPPAEPVVAPDEAIAAAPPADPPAPVESPEAVAAVEPPAPPAEPPTTRAVRDALQVAARAIDKGEGADEMRRTAALVDALVASLPEGEKRAEWTVRRATQWRRLAARQEGEARVASLLAARRDLVYAMDHGAKTRNFKYYKRALGITEELEGRLSPAALDFACDEKHLGRYMHRRNHCAVLRIRAGKKLLESNPLGAAALICAGHDMFVAELPGLSEAQIKRRRSERRDYGAHCNLARKAIKAAEAEKTP